MGRLLFLLYHTKWLFLLFQLLVSFEIQIISFIIILGTHVLWLVFITKAQWTFCGLLSAFVVLGPFKCNHKNISHHWGKVKHSSYLQYNFNESKCFGDISTLLPLVYFCCTAPSVSLHLFSLYIVHNLLWLNFSSQGWIILKSEGVLSWYSWLLNLWQFLIRPVWRKISTWCNKISFIQKYTLKRTS